MQGDQVGLCRPGRSRKRLSKHPSNSKGSEVVCPGATAERHAGLRDSDLVVLGIIPTAGGGRLVLLL